MLEEGEEDSSQEEDNMDVVIPEDPVPEPEPEAIANEVAEDMPRGNLAKATKRPNQSTPEKIRKKKPSPSVSKKLALSKS